MNGAIAWMTRNPVASNLLMLTILFVGATSVLQVKQQTFPETSLDAVQIRVEYPGAGPDEIEQSILLRVEEQIAGVEGIRRVTSTAAENVGIVTAQLRTGADPAGALNEIKSEIDGLTNLPEGAGRPEVSELKSLSRALQLALYGNASEGSLKEMAERIKDDLTATDDVSFVEITGVRPYEISIEVDPVRLQSLGLSIPQVAQIVRRASMDLPGGSLQTSAEEILVRTEGQNYTQRDFEEIVVIGRPDGTQILLRDIAVVNDGFEDVDLVTRFNGERSAMIEVYRSADERVLDVVDATKTYIAEELVPSLPEGLAIEVWQDESKVLASRLNLLVRNAIMGLLLVIVALALFLNARLAFWASFGILTSFIGAFGLMLLLDVSVNVISVFGFILALGIVVDDAIVVGENIASEQDQGGDPVEATVQGVTRVMRPVIFAVLTTITAFAPLLFMPGPLGNLVGDIPTIVIIVLLISVVESLLILPKHLTHRSHKPGTPAGRALEWAQHAVDRGLRRFIDGPLDRAVRFAITQYGIVLATAVSLFVIMAGLVSSGTIKTIFFPAVEGDMITAVLELAPGTPTEQTVEAVAVLEQAGRETAAELQATLDNDHPPLVTNMFVRVGMASGAEGGPVGSGGSGVFQSHVAEVRIELVDAELRDLSSKVFEDAWRARVGEIPGARSLSFASEAFTLGKAVQVDLSADDPVALEQSVEDLKRELGTFAGVFDIADDLEDGKAELRFDLLPAATTLGLTLEDLARQVRAGYFGEEALRIQRGRDEVAVFVRLPEDDRNGLGDLADFQILTPKGTYVPLFEVARVTRGIAPVSITRRDGRRVVSVTAEIDETVATSGEVNAQLQAEVIPAIQQRYPGLEASFEGEQAEQAEAYDTLWRLGPIALFLIYCLLAIPFGSYVQPLVIMSAIPFGLLGALLGHLVFGIPLSIQSIFGIVGLSGVVVNDSMVLVDFINEQRRAGSPVHQAVLDGAKLRFRPILLTTITTFLGITPLMLEQSVQAQFLIPMAVSLGFGVLFATVITMLLVPSLLLWQHDLAAWVRNRSMQLSRTEA